MDSELKCLVYPDSRAEEPVAITHMDVSCRGNFQTHFIPGKYPYVDSCYHLAVMDNFTWVGTKCVWRQPALYNWNHHYNWKESLYNEPGLRLLERHFHEPLIEINHISPGQLSWRYLLAVRVHVGYGAKYPSPLGLKHPATQGPDPVRIMAGQKVKGRQVWSCTHWMSAYSDGS